MNPGLSMLVAAYEFLEWSGKQHVPGLLPIMSSTCISGPFVELHGIPSRGEHYMPGPLPPRLRAQIVCEASSLESIGIL